MTFASRVAARLPERLLVMLVSLAYPRFEPEIRRLDEVCGRGGTMVDVGGRYGPWTRRLVHRADRVVIVEPTPLHQVLRRTLPLAAHQAGHAMCPSAACWHGPCGRSRGTLTPCCSCPRTRRRGLRGLCILITPRDEAGVIPARVGRLG